MNIKKENLLSGPELGLKEEPIPLRPHHGMCLAYFKGMGYSDGFSVHMQEMLEIFQKGAKIRLHADTDEICSACPNNEKGRCSSCSLVEKYDIAVLDLCGLKKEQVMDFDAFTAKVQKEILSSGKRKEICGNRLITRKER